GRLLSPAVEFEMTAVEVQPRVDGPSHAANSEWDFAGVHRPATGAHSADHAVQIRRFPKLRSGPGAGKLDIYVNGGLDLARLLHLHNIASIAIEHDGARVNRHPAAEFVLNGQFHIDPRGTIANLR